MGGMMSSSAFAGSAIPNVCVVLPPREYRQYVVLIVASPEVLRFRIRLQSQNKCHKDGSPTLNFAVGETEPSQQDLSFSGILSTGTKFRH